MKLLDRRTVRGWAEGEWIVQVQLAIVADTAEDAEEIAAQALGAQ